ncbi:3-dehydroquinate synthase [Crocinitomix catalasitica]|uniref:3-dehydroquinate synthase n=1 Tax=Crocinitomix catalasitica TaxID=184607 RepID=UPI00056A57DC|nr:3-dehydroquinate synthase [Crocinitomix catalasitica]
MKSQIIYKDIPINFGDLSSSVFNELILTGQYAQSKKIILTDENVFDHWIEYLVTNFEGLAEAEIIQIPAGEDNKVLEICSHIWNALSEYEITRNDVLINIGGGVITDMGGFIAGTFKRGINFINIPTSILAQVDASVGGKTGIDLGPFKNQIGLFNEPSHVFIDPNFINTLPEIERLSGYAEMIKHGLIADRKYWNQLTSLDLNNLPENFDEYIQASVQIKADIVTADPFEKGDRKKLNFGHTIGHAIEGFMLEIEQPIQHGIAIAWGILAEASIALSKKMILQEEFNEINHFIQLKYPTIKLSPTDKPRITKLLLNDKKNENDEINFTLLKGIGDAVINQTASDVQINAALDLVINPSI